MNRTWKAGAWSSRLRLPTVHDRAGALPSRGEIFSGQRDVSEAEPVHDAARDGDGRAIIPGHVFLRRAESLRLLAIDELDRLFVNFMLPLAAISTEADVA